ncbi:recombinase family protein (plasmid) [Agrobacterium tumefaciens]|uniref:recombinase family protein n=1 Tax=Agrobacterium tumefaciens TaxID=358 RepID=UPI001572432E|nr:recombinase family protein [Agrobacterium tumefaciens]WCA73020.1 recombinase family protein [Agrobacterium tumefaciens]
MSEAAPIKYGYARVLTDDQKLDLQMDALLRAGVARERIFTDEAGGARVAGRPGLKSALKALHPGSMLIVWKIDRLGRNLSELIQTADLVRQKGAELVSLTESIDTSNAFGKAMYHMIGLFAQLERDMIVERTKAGVAAARERGNLPGRRSPLTTEKRSEIVRHMLSGLSFEQIAPLVGVSKSTLYNHADDLRAEMAATEANELSSK